MKMLAGFLRIVTSGPGLGGLGERIVLGWPSTPSPLSIVRTVRSTIRRSRPADWVSTYSTSNSIRRAQVRLFRPLTWARPVSPGRTSRRRRWNSS